MAKMIQVKNVRNGVISEMEESHWNKIKDDPQWKGVFKPVVSPEPPEVTKLRETKKSSAKPKKEQNNETEQPEQGE